MKEIILKSANEDKLQAELDAVQKRTTERNITIDDIVSALLEIEEKLSIPKKSMNGIRVFVDCNAQSFPNAYKYTPKSTQFWAVYRNGSWRVDEIARYKVCSPSFRVQVQHTEESKKALLKRFENWE